MKLFDLQQNKIRYSLNPDLYFILEDEYLELYEVLATSRLNGHDRYDQWMMKMEIKMKELLDTISELDDDDNYNERGEQFVADVDSGRPINTYAKKDS